MFDNSHGRQYWPSMSADVARVGPEIVFHFSVMDSSIFTANRACAFEKF